MILTSLVLVALAAPTPAATPSPVLITPPAAAVSASTHDGNEPGNVVDNDLGTRWSGRGDGAWLQLDLGRRHNVLTVRLAAYRGNTRHNRFEIQISDDAVSWTTVLAAQTSGTGLGQEGWAFGWTPGRYVRYVGHGYVSTDGVPGPWNSVTELDLFGYVIPGPNAPPAPAEVRAVPRSRSVRVTWAPVEGATSYAVRRRVWEPFCGTTGRVVAVVTGTSFTDTVTQPRRYGYTVTARALGDESFESAEAMASPQLTRLLAPRLTATAGGDGDDASVRLRWTASEGAGGYRLFRRFAPPPGCPGGPFALVATLGGSRRSYTDSTVGPGTVYEFQVTAATQGGREGQASNVARAVTMGTGDWTRTAPPACDAPSSPGSETPGTVPGPASVRDGLPGDGHVRLHWMAADGATDGHNVYRGDPDACGPFTLIARGFAPVEGGTPVAYFDAGAANGKGQMYVVAGENGAGEGPWGAVGALPSTQQPPLRLLVVRGEVDDGRVLLEWSPAYKADQYLVRRSLSPFGPFETVGTVGNDRFIDDAVVNGTTYHYTVVPLGAGGEGPESDVVGLTPSPRTVP